MQKARSINTHFGRTNLLLILQYIRLQLL